MSLAARTGILAIGNLVYRLTQTLTLIAVVRLVSPEEVGTYRQVWVLYNSLYVFFMLGLPGSTYYHLAAAEPGRHRRFLRQTSLLLAGLGTLFAGGLAGASTVLPVSMHNPALRATLLAICPYALFSVANSYTYPALVVYRRSWFASGVTVLSSLCQLLVTVTVLSLGGGLVSMFLLLGVVSAGFLSLSTWLVWSRVPPSSAPWAERPLAQQLRYAVPLGLADATTTLQGQIDKIVASLFYLPAFFAQYSLGAVPLPFITVIRSAVFSVLLSEVSARRAAGEIGQILTIWRAAVRKTALIFYPLLFGGLVCAEALMSTLYTASYRDAAIPFRVYLGMLALMVYPASSVVLALGSSAFQFRVNLAGLALTVGLGALLVRPLGLVGPALGALAALTVVVFLQLRHISKELDVGVIELLALRTQMGPLLVSAIAAVPALGVAQFHWNVAFSLLLQSATYMVVYVPLLWLTPALSSGDRDQLRSMWAKLRGAR